VALIKEAMMKEEIINYLRSRGVEPTQEDIEVFMSILNNEFEEERDRLEKSLDKAGELINTLYESGCLDLQREQIVQKYLFT
jgi:hypothetical protein